MKSKVEDRRDYQLLKPERIPVNPGLSDVAGDIGSTKTDLGKIDDSYVDMSEGAVSSWSWMAPLVAVVGVVILGAVFICYVKCCGGLMRFQENRRPAPRVNLRRPPVESVSSEMVPMNTISTTYARGLSVSGPIEPYAYATLAEVGKRAETDPTPEPLPAGTPATEQPPPPPIPIQDNPEAKPVPAAQVAEYLEPGYLPMQGLEKV